MDRFYQNVIVRILYSLHRFSLECFVRDIKIKRVLKGKAIKFFLKKYIDQVKNIELPSQKNEPTKIIWQYWEQGIENAPEIVKICVESVEKYKNDYQHIVLDKNSINDYIEIPKYIVELNNRGVIKSAHFSDIIRTFLLLSSTIYLGISI